MSEDIQPTTSPPNQATTNNTTVQHEKQPSQATSETASASAKEVTSESSDDKPEHEYPGMTVKILVSIALALAVFCASLDEIIVATAVPTISSDFNAISDLGWYGAAYAIVACALQMTWGKLYTILSIKWSFLSCLGLFELGNVIAGAAQNSVTVIVGRAVSGIGTAGIQSGAFIIIAHTIPLAQRPLYLSTIGALYTIAAVVGPIIGGALTQSVTWRWVFFINLPLGGATILISLFLLPNNMGEADRKPLTLKEKIVSQDIPGSILLIGTVISLLLALQWGGVTYPWDDGRVIALLVVAAVAGCIFAAWIIHRKDKALLPVRILKQRSVAASAWWGFWNGISTGVLLYYLPTFFQAVKEYSPRSSGLILLAFLLSLIISSMVAGGLIQYIGYPVVGAYIGSLLMPIGAGLMTTFNQYSALGTLIGYQIIFGTGAGFGAGQPITLVQVVLPTVDVPVGTSLIIFFQTLGISVAIAIGQSVYLNYLVDGLEALLPGTTRSQLLAAGATSILGNVPDYLREKAVDVYVTAIQNTFKVAIGGTCALLIGTLLMEWKTVKKEKKKEGENADEESGGKKTSEVKESDTKIEDEKAS